MNKVFSSLFVVFNFLLSTAYVYAIDKQPAHPLLTKGDKQLTIDNNLQQFALNALGDEKGTIVAIDPNNGKVLVRVNKSVTPFSLYNPGATIKPFIALAGLELNATSTDKKIYCPGYYQLKGQTTKYRDWKRWGHGDVNMHDAIVKSCDVYFYDLAYHLGIGKIHSFLSQFGFGQKTRIDLPNEPSGFVASKIKEIGETLVTGIGQGTILVSTIQLASAVATLANYGTRYQPQIDSSLSPEISNNISIQNKENWAKVIKAMRDAVHSERGTARLIGRQKRPYEIAGKIGVVQVLKTNHNHVLFIGFAPVNKPQIAIAVVLENTSSSGSTAASVAAKVIDSYFLNIPDHKI